MKRGMKMYKVRIETRMDILGNVIDRFNVEVDQYTTKKEAKSLAEQMAHKENCQRYGIPVHFKALTCSNWINE
jgi:hypothetical protein